MRKTNSDKLDDSKEEEFRLKKESKKAKVNKLPLNPIILFLLGTLTSVLIAELLPVNKNLESVPETLQASNVPFIETSNVSSDAATIKRPTFAVYTKLREQKSLAIIRRILRFFGYTEVGIDDDWNLLWGFESPFYEESRRVRQLKPHQMINHVPGMDFLVSKHHLSASGSPHMPRVFELPKEKEEFLSYGANYPDKRFFQLRIEHQNVEIKKPKDFNLNSNLTFVQEFAPNPYLVDGYKFEIGVYAVITSVEPVRLYAYTGDVLFRYCQEKYYPFNSKAPQKNIPAAFKYRPTWKVPSLKKYFKRYGGGMRASFDAHLRDQGQDPSVIWEQAEEIVRHTVVTQAKQMASRLKQYPVHNFFELIRVDMGVDINLKVHLSEVIMSPNLNSNIMKRNRVLFQQVLYNGLQLAGVGSPIKQRNYLSNIDERIIAIAEDKNVASSLNECVENGCHKDCENESKCGLCITCLNDEEYTILTRAHREHIHRADMKRIFPKPIQDVDNFDLDEESRNLTAINRWMVKWFYHKCVFDRSWCQ